MESATEEEEEEDPSAALFLPSFLEAAATASARMLLEISPILERSMASSRPHLSAAFVTASRSDAVSRPSTVAYFLAKALRFLALSTDSLLTVAA